MLPASGPQLQDDRGKQQKLRGSGHEVRVHWVRSRERGARGRGRQREHSREDADHHRQWAGDEGQEPPDAGHKARHERKNPSAIRHVTRRKIDQEGPEKREKRGEGGEK